MAERKLLLQLLAFIFGPAIDILHLYFESKILQTITFENFLNDKSNKHTLFHEYIPTIPCCECINTVSIAAKSKRGCLNKSQFIKLYDESGPVSPNHQTTKGTSVSQHCLCKFFARQLKVVDLDIPLVCSIISHCCSTIFGNITWLSDIRDARNSLVHNSCGEITDIKFKAEWNKLETAVLGIAAKIGSASEKQYRRQIGQLNNKSVEDLKSIIQDANDNIIELRNILNGVTPIKMVMDETKEVLEKVSSVQQAHGEDLKDIHSRLDNIEAILYGKYGNLQTISDIKRHTHKPDQGTVETKCHSDTDYSQHDVVITIITPSSWNKQTIQEKLSAKLKSNQQQVDDDDVLHLVGFKCESLILKTRASRKLIKDRSALLMAISAFLEEIFNDCEIDTSIPDTLFIEIDVFSPFKEDCHKREDFMFHEVKAEPVEEIKKKMDIDVEKLKKTGEPQIKETEILFTQSDRLQVAVKNILFNIVLKGIPSPEKVHENETYYVQWILACSEFWNLESLLPRMEQKLQYLTDCFKVDTVYLDVLNRLCMETTTQQRVFNNILSAVKSFLEMTVDVFNLKSEKPITVPVDVIVISGIGIRKDNAATIGSDSEDKNTGSKDVKEGIEANYGDIKRLLGDSIVSCDYCSKRFRCKKCIKKEKVVRRLMEANQMKERTIAKLEKEYMSEQLEDKSYMPELGDKEFMPELEDRDILQGTQDKILLKHTKPKTKGTESEESEFDSEEKTFGEPVLKKKKNVQQEDISLSKDKDVNITPPSGTLIDNKTATEKISAWMEEICAVNDKVSQCIKIRRKFGKKPPIWKRRRWLRNLNDTQDTNAKFKKLESIIENLKEFRLQTKTKINNYLGVIQEEKRTGLYTDKIYNLDLTSIIKCSLCNTLDENILQAFCDSCKSLLCNKCVLAHLLNTPAHQIEYDDILVGFWCKSAISIEGDTKAAQWVSSNAVAVLRQQYQLTYFTVYGTDGNRIHDVVLSRYNSNIYRGFIVCIHDDSVVVTHDRASYMEIINYTSGKILNNGIPIHSDEYGTIRGVAFISNHLFVAFSQGIEILNMLGEEQNRIDLKDVEIMRPLGSGKLYCRHRSQTSSDIISSCLEIQNNIMPTFTDFKFNPDDVTADNEGGIIFINNGVVCQADLNGRNSIVIITNFNKDSILETKNFTKFSYISWERLSNTLAAATHNKIWFYCKYQN